MMIGTFETSNNWIKPKTNNGIAIKFDVNNAKIDFILSKLCLMLKNGICENILNIRIHKLAEIIVSNILAKSLDIKPTIIPLKSAIK